MKLVLSPAFSLLPFSLLPHLLPGPLALVLLGHSAFVLAVLSTCTLMLLSGQLHQLPWVFLQISLLLLCFIYIFFCLFVCLFVLLKSSLVAQMVKKKKKSVCNSRDLGFIPGSGRSPGEGNGNPLCNFALRIPWTEEPCGLQSTGSQRVRHAWVTNTHT